jgi:hydrogenase expression/formation protein HypC
VSDRPTTGAGAGAGPLLPVLGTPPRDAPVTGAACTVDDDGCITCGDVAVALTVIEVGEFDALCRDDAGRTEQVATELVGPVAAGDRVLVHAKVALEVLAPPPGTHPGGGEEEDAHAVR